MRKLLILTLLCPFLSMCQPLSLKGKIINEQNESIPAATITLKRANPNTEPRTSNIQQTLSNEKGEFFLTNLYLDDTIIITAVGYETATEVYDQSLVAHNQLTVILKKRIGLLDEAVVIAYGTTTRRLSTGTVSRITADEIARQPVTNPLAALQDRVPGLLITQSSGLPGAAFSVQLRGRTSIAQSSAPLFIIDGVPFAPGNNNLNVLSSSLTVSVEGGGISPFSTINPADIESIEVLKDADATAIYGSRGANGVILITTKKGRVGKTTFTFNATTGFSQATRLMQLMNTQQYLQMRREAFANDSATPTTANAYDLLIFDTTRYTDFTRLFFGGAAASTGFGASLSGGTLQTRFLLGAGYNAETTAFPGSLGSKRASFSFRLNHLSVNRRFSTDFAASYSYNSNNLLSNNFATALLLPPDYPSFFDDNGNLLWDYKGISLQNPYAYLLQTYLAQAANLQSSLQLNYYLSKKLSAKLSLGYNKLTSTEESKNPKASYNPSSGVAGNASFGNAAFQDLIIEPQLNFRSPLAKGSLQILVGGTWQASNSNSFYITGSNYANDALMGSIEAAGTITARRNSLALYRYTALFSRLTYNYRSKYLLNLSGRADGSSRFGPGRQWGAFAAAGAGWIFTEEKWTKNFKWLSFGKLRASYGTTGNDKIGDYQYLNTWSTTPAYQGVGGLAPTALYNPGYHWEVNKKLEAGLDLGFAADHFLLSLVYYRTRSTGQLLQYKLPAQVGFASVIDNFPATVQNQGWELELTTQTLKTKNFLWTSVFQLSLPKNSLQSFPGIETSSYSSLMVGQPLSIYGGYRFLGVNPATGLYELADKNGKTITTAISADRILNLGNTEPLFYGSLSNTLAYKEWQLSFLFGFKKGNGLNYLSQLAAKYPGTINNLPVEVLNRWQHPGDVAAFQKYTQAFAAAGQAAALFAQQVSDCKYGDASFIRLRNLSLAYAFSGKWKQRMHVDDARLFVQGQNLLTITGYKGADPENQNFLTLPPLRTITAGIQFTF